MLDRRRIESSIAHIDRVMSGRSSTANRNRSRTIPSDSRLAASARPGVCNGSSVSFNGIAEISLLSTDRQRVEVRSGFRVISLNAQFGEGWLLPGEVAMFCPARRSERRQPATVRLHRQSHRLEGRGENAYAGFTPHEPAVARLRRKR